MSTVLHEIKKRFGGRLRKCQIYDANVCDAKWPPAMPWKVETISGGPFLQELRFSYRSHSVKIHANDSWISISTKGGFEAGVFSLNARRLPGYKSCHAGNRRFANSEFPIFTQDGELSVEHINLLSLPELEKLAQEIQPNTHEIVGFTRDEVEVYLHQSNLEQVERVVNKIVDLASRFATDPEQLNLTALPASFHDLIPLIRKWAVADDSDREALIEDSRETELKDLVREVERRLQEINDYLDSLGEKITEEGAALGRLAECAIEAKLWGEGQD